MTDITPYLEKLHEAAVASPHSRHSVIQQLKQMLIKLEEAQPIDALSPLETMPLHLLQMIVDEATVESVARLLRTSSTMHERLLHTTKWMPPLISYESRFFPNIVKYYYYRAVSNDYGHMSFHHEELGCLVLEHLLRTPFRFEALEISPGLCIEGEIGAYGIQKEVTETKDLGLAYSYSYRPFFDDALLEKDYHLMRKIAKDFVVTVEEFKAEDIEIVRFFLERFKLKAVYFNYLTTDIQITAELLPELLPIPFLNVDHNLDKFSMDIILEIAQVEGGCLEKWQLEEILKHFTTAVDLKIKRHVYMLKRGISPQDITDVFEQKGGRLKIGEHLPTWKCDQGRKRLLLVKKNRYVVITIVDL